MNTPYHFFYVLTAIYFFYYLFNLLFDLLRSKAGPAPQQQSLLIEVSGLEEPIDASVLPEGDRVVIGGDSSALLSSGPIRATGGVSLAEAVGLAEGDTLVLTSQIAS
jgi:hypothetical protein